MGVRRQCGSGELCKRAANAMSALRQVSGHSVRRVLEKECFSFRNLNAVGSSLDRAISS